MNAQGSLQSTRERARMKVLSKLAPPHTYPVDTKVQDIDDGIESDALELKGQDGLALYVFPGTWVGINADVSACSLYDENGVRVGILERSAGFGSEAVLLFQARNVWSTFFQDWDFESSPRVFADLFTDRDLQVTDMWLRNYGGAISAEDLLMTHGPYVCIKPSDSPEVSEESLKTKRVVFLDESYGITTYKQSFSIGFLDFPLGVQSWIRGRQASPEPPFGGRPTMIPLPGGVGEGAEGVSPPIENS